MPHGGARQNGGPVIQALRRRLSYANVMATLAVFIALGGSSYAALTISGRDVVNGSLTNRDLKRDTLGGSRIKESRLGKVKQARNADRLNGVTAARLLVRCRRARFLSPMSASRPRPRAPVPYSSAAVLCEITDRRAGPGRRLPSHDELMTALGDYGITLARGGRTHTQRLPLCFAARTPRCSLHHRRFGTVALTPNTAAGAKAFRCVADPLN